MPDGFPVEITRRVGRASRWSAPRRYAYSWLLHRLVRTTLLKEHPPLTRTRRWTPGRCHRTSVAMLVTLFNNTSLLKCAVGTMEIVGQIIPIDDQSLIYLTISSIPFDCWLYRFCAIIQQCTYLFESTGVIRIINHVLIQFLKQGVIRH